MLMCGISVTIHRHAITESNDAMQKKNNNILKLRMCIFYHCIPKRHQRFSKTVNTYDGTSTVLHFRLYNIGH